MSSTEYDLIDRQLIEDHLASGQPRYSNTLYLLGGGFVRRWTDDHDAAMARHATDIADPRMRWAITFDHLGIDTLAVDFPPHGKTAEQLKAECDAALDEMMDRWMANQAA